MYTIQKVLGLALGLGPNETFTTRSLVPLGTRSAIDNATYTLVKRGVIERVAWGVYRLSAETLQMDLPELPSLEIVAAKLHAFGREFNQKAASALIRLQPEKLFTFPTQSHSGNFKRFYNDGRKPENLKIRTMAPRKIAVAASQNGLALMAHWLDGTSGGEVPRPAPSEWRWILPYLPHWMTTPLNMAAFAKGG